MHSVIIADRFIATRERHLLSRLEVGLADEGVRVIHAVPRSVLEETAGQGAGLYSTTVPYQDRGFSFTDQRRARELSESIDSLSDGAAKVDVVHAFGLGSWPVASHLALLRGAGLLLELWRPQLAAQGARWAHTPGPRRFVPEFIASEPSVAAALRARSPTLKVYSAPWGVHAPARPRPPFPGGRPLAVAVLCDTGQPRWAIPALRGLIDAAAGVEVLIFACVDAGSSSREAALWRAARRLGVLDRFSVSPDMESRREPILEMDLLLLPEAHGRQRTFTLEAMAVGMPVVAAADPFLESLAEGATSRLVGTPTPAAWAKAIGPIITDPAATGDLIRAAHEWVRSNRSATRHIADVLRAYEQAAGARVAA